MTEQTTVPTYNRIRPFDTEDRTDAGYRVHISCGMIAFPWHAGGPHGADVHEGVYITVTPDEEINDDERAARTVRHSYDAPGRHQFYPDVRNNLGQDGAYVFEWLSGAAFDEWLQARIDHLVGRSLARDTDHKRNYVEREYTYTPDGKWKVYQGLARDGIYHEGMWFYAPHPSAYPEWLGHFSQSCTTRAEALREAGRHYAERDEARRS